MAVTKKETEAAEAAAKPDKVAPATEFNPSGAPQQVVDDVDPSHPSVDNNPREGTTVGMNQIDFNEPSALKSPEEQVEEDLKGK
jgi:hypothetical protein